MGQEQMAGVPDSRDTGRKLLTLVWANAPENQWVPVVGRRECSVEFPFIFFFFPKSDILLRCLQALLPSLVTQIGLWEALLWLSSFPPVNEEGLYRPWLWQGWVFLGVGLLGQRLACLFWLPRVPSSRPPPSVYFAFGLNRTALFPWVLCHSSLDKLSALFSQLLSSLPPSTRLPNTHPGLSRSSPSALWNHLLPILQAGARLSHFPFGGGERGFSEASEREKLVPKGSCRPEVIGLVKAVTLF